MADALWEPDGTQPPPTPKAWDDPIAGLVTGAGYVPEEPIRVEYAKPAMPDMDEVRRAVDAALAGEDEPAAGPKIPSPRRLQAPKVTPGIVPPNPRAGWPRTPPLRQLPRLRQRQPAPPPPPPRRGEVRGSQGLSAGIGLIAVLALLVIAIVVTILISFVDMVSAIFN